MPYYSIKICINYKHVCIFMVQKMKIISNKSNLFFICSQVSESMVVTLVLCLAPSSTLGHWTLKSEFTDRMPNINYSTVVQIQVIQ